MAKNPRDKDGEGLAPHPQNSESGSELTRADQSDDGGTRVDLGEDLLERTAVLTIPGVRSAPPPVLPRSVGGPSFPPPLDHSPSSSEMEMPATGPLSSEQLADQMQSARILMGEGILEDAKKILRRILLSDSSSVEARKMLESIHETELKQIFGESDTPRHQFRRRMPATPVEISADIVMQSLDRDLKLGIFDHDGANGPDTGEGREPQLSLFKDRAAMDAFGAQMDRDFGGRPAPERIDLGIAFLEMGLYDLSARHFQAAVNHLVLQELGDSLATDAVLAATGLLAYALILGGRAFEATHKLQNLLNDVDIDRVRKLDLIYLMGRACEAMGKRGDARQWFTQALEIEPGYRDIPERLRKFGVK